MKAAALRQVIASAREGHRLEALTCRTPSYQDFKQFEKFLNKVSGTHKDQDLDLDIISGLRASLSKHWLDIRGTEHSYENDPSSFPNCFYQPIIAALIKAKLLPPQFLDTNVANEACLNVDVLAIPAEHVFKTQDNYIYDIQQLIQFMSKGSIPHLEKRNQTLITPVKFPEFYLSLPGKQQKIIVDQLIQMPVDNIRTILESLDYNNANRAPTALAGLKLMPIFANECLAKLATVDDLTSTQKEIVQCLHHFCQENSQFYPHAHYCQLADGHLYQPRELIGMLSNKGIVRAHNNHVVYLPAQVFDAFEHLPAEQEWDFVEKVFSLGTDFAYHAFMNVNEQLLRHIVNTTIKAEETTHQTKMMEHCISLGPHFIVKLIKAMQDTNHETALSFLVFMKTHAEANFLSQHKDVAIAIIQSIGSSTQCLYEHSLDKRIQELITESNHSQNFTATEPTVKFERSMHRKPNGGAASSTGKGNGGAASNAMLPKGYSLYHPLAEDNLPKLQAKKQFNRMLTQLGATVCEFLLTNDYFSTKAQTELLLQLPKLEKCQKHYLQCLRYQPQWTSQRAVDEFQKLKHIHPNSDLPGSKLWERMSRGYDKDTEVLLYDIGKLAFHGFKAQPVATDTMQDKLATVDVEQLRELTDNFKRRVNSLGIH